MHWCSVWHMWLAGDVGSRKLLGPISILISIALPCALLGYGFSYLWIESTILTFLGGIALLLWCFGPGDTGRDIELYSNAYRDPTDDANASTNGNFLNHIYSSGLNSDAAYQRAIAIVSNERVFAPAMWFAVLGPLGALLFRMASVLSRADAVNGAELALVRRLHEILLWVPSRLFALGLGLAGSLGPVLAKLTKQSYPLDAIDNLVGDAAMAAHELPVDEDDSGDRHLALINSMLSLVKRAFVVWLAILAIGTAAGIV